MKNNILRLLLGLLICLSVPAALAQGTAFTYQGQLSDAGRAANGIYDFSFTLLDAPAAGAIIGGPVPINGIPVSNGLFTVRLDFGAGAFTGPARWLQINARTNGVGPLTPLTPRTELTPTPYSVFAGTAGAVTAGSIGTTQIATGGVQGVDILDGTVGSADLANDSVTSIKVLDGSLLGGDLADNSITSVQLADSIELGSPSVAGTLSVYRTSSNTPSIRLTGASSQISTFGSDSKEQIRLWGNNFGEIYLYDSGTNNYVAATLSANGTSGGLLGLRQGNSSSWGLLGYGDSLGGGRVYGYTGSNTVGMDIRSQYSASIPAAWIGLYDNGLERIAMAARNGTTGQGGLIDVKNDSNLNTIRLIGDTGSLDSELHMYAGGTNLSLRLLADDSSSGSAIYLNNGVGQTRIEIDSDDGDSASIIRMYDATGGYGLILDADSTSAGYVAVYGTNGSANIILDGRDSGGAGRVICDVLQINGGSDLSEQFDVAATGQEVEPGSVVCIDPVNPGKLVLSASAYDRTVAGIVSGAGGVKPGMLMGQQGTLASGKHPVALTGRVYCRVDAANGPIEPGDLITTSPVPGHGMKVTDHARAQGAIIGKAMTGLQEGRGMVLVLVSLQ